MEGLNPLFKRNNNVSYPSNFSSKQKTPLSISGKNFLKPDSKEINKEIAAYLDILYNDNDKNILSNTDKLKLNNAYMPIKGKFFNPVNFFIR